MRLFEIISKRDSLEKELEQEIKDFKSKRDRLKKEIDELKSLEQSGENGLDVEKIQLAEKVIRVEGNPYGKTSEVTKFGYKPLAEQAMIDIANGCKHLKTQYFGNKVYGGFYQQCSCEYGYGPRHGGISDRISLIVKNRELTEEEKDACIYYLKNYKIIERQELGDKK